jgi:uncharacterized tellurite resistance protein B-like protein
MNSNPQLELMETPTIDFSLKEKLAIVNALDSVIHADGKVHTGEINALSELMNSLDFDSNFIVQARNLSTAQSLSLLDKMTHVKKVFISNVLDKMANADGFLHEKEITLILSIFKAIGINRIPK